MVTECLQIGITVQVHVDCITCILVSNYHNSQIFRVTKFNDALIIFGQVTPYHTIVNNAHNFHVLNFWTGHAVRKRFNSENFPIYGTFVEEIETV